MYKKILFSAAVLLIFFAFDARGGVINSTWVGGALGPWEGPLYWDPPTVPDNTGDTTFIVTVDPNYIGAECVEITIGWDHTVNRIDTYGEVHLSRQNYQYAPNIEVLEPNGLINHGFLEIEDEIVIKGDVLNTSGAWLNGWFDIENGNLVNMKDARIDATDGNIDVHDENIYNYGSIIATTASGLWSNKEFNNYGEIENYGGMCSSDQTFSNHISGVIKGFGMIHSDEYILNEGFIQSCGGGLLLHSREDFEGPYLVNRGFSNMGKLMNGPGSSLNIRVWVPDVNNLGTIEVHAGGGIAFGCNLVNEPNSGIKLYGGILFAPTITQKADATLQGFGGITGDVVIETDGIIKLTGPTNIVGDVEIKNDATLEVSDGLTLITGKTVCNGTIHIKGGYLIPQGGLSGNCNIIWEPGLYTNVADFNLDGQVNLKDFAYFADVWLWQTAWR